MFDVVDVCYFGLYVGMLFECMLCGIDVYIVW